MYPVEHTNNYIQLIFVFQNLYKLFACEANLENLFVSYHPHHKKISHRATGKTFFYLIQTKYYFLFQMLPSPESQHKS